MNKLMVRTSSKKSNNKGFSLVELIIVIAIMAVLVAILAPQLLKYVERSREAKDRTVTDEIDRAITIALADETTYLATDLSADFDITVENNGTVLEVDVGGATANTALAKEIAAILGVTTTSDTFTIPGTSYSSAKFKDVTVTFTVKYNSTSKAISVSNDIPA